MIDLSFFVYGIQRCFQTFSQIDCHGVIELPHLRHFELLRPDVNGNTFIGRALQGKTGSKVYHLLWYGYPDCRTVSLGTGYIHEPAHLMNKAIYYGQADTYTSGTSVPFLVCLVHPPGYTRYVGSGHADTGIGHFYRQIDAIVMRDGKYPDVYTSAFGEFDRIVQQIPEHLVEFLDISRSMVGISGAISTTSSSSLILLFAL